MKYKTGLAGEVCKDMCRIYDKKQFPVLEVYALRSSGGKVIQDHHELQAEAERIAALLNAAETKTENPLYVSFEVKRCAEFKNNIGTVTTVIPLEDLPRGDLTLKQAGKVFYTIYGRKPDGKAVAMSDFDDAQDATLTLAALKRSL